jgi:hypothetical protein
VKGPVPSAEDVRRAVTRVLEEPSFTATARRFQTRMHSLPPLHVAIAELEALAKGHSLDT